MTGENPYAPPQAGELESRTVFSHNHWKIYADTLIVRNGATLPKVDPAHKRRLLRDNEETDQLLTKNGLQSETREG